MALRAARILSLCAGVGGLDLGIRLAEPEARSVCYVEREAAAAAILVARMEDGWLHPAPIWSDLATFDAGAWRGAVDCVVSGDPCQPNSEAGRMRGQDDERWLADQVLRTFADSGARRLFRENVTGNAAGQLAYFVPALEDLGCRVACGIFSARAVGAGHRRDRLIIMADRDGVGQPGISEPGGGSITGCQASPRWRHAHRCDQDLAHADGLGRWSQGHPGLLADDAVQSGSRLAGTDGGGFGAWPGLNAEHATRRRTTTDRGCIGLFAPGPLDPRWPDIIARAPHLEPAVRRMADGMADRVDRLRACGNGVVPLVAGYAWRTLEARLAEADAGGAAVTATPIPTSVGGVTG